MRTGIADYVFVTPLKTAFLEVKTRSGTLTDTQKSFRDECITKDIAHYVLKTSSVDEAFIFVRNLVASL